MIIKEINSKKMYKEYSIEIPYKDIANSINEKIEKLLPSVELPGFRKGKAPLNIVKKKYENNVIAEVIENLAKENTKKLIDNKKLKPLRQPKVEIAKFEKNNPLELKLKIDLEPKLDLIDFNKIKIKKYDIKIDKKTFEENYNKYINSLSRYSKLQKNRALKMSDKAIINLHSNDSLVPDFLKKQENFSLYTDSENQLLPNISKILIKSGLKIGDTIKRNFDLKNILKEKNKKIAEFEIKIISKEEKKELEINKDFLNKNNCKTVNELKDKVNSSLKTQYENYLKEIEKKQLYDLLESKHDFDIPEGIYDEEYNQIWTRVDLAKKNNTLDDDDKKLSDIKLKDRYKKIATRRVKLAIILQKIAEKDSIVVTNDEITNGLLQYASQYPGKEKQIFEFYKKNPQQIEAIRAPIFEKKVLDSVLKKTIREKQTITINEFNKLQKKEFIFNNK